MLHLKLLEKQEQAKPKASRREIIKIKTEINEIETKKKPYKESMKQKAINETRLTNPWQI
jgi:hypothetical protein